MLNRKVSCASVCIANRVVLIWKAEIIKYFEVLELSVLAKYDKMRSDKYILPGPMLDSSLEIGFSPKFSKMATANMPKDNLMAEVERLIDFLIIIK